MISKNITTNLAKQIDDIIDRIDVASASELLRKLSSLPPEERYSLDNTYNESVIKLQVVDFLDLSDSEAADITRNHLLVFFKIDVPFERRLIARYTFQGMPEKNNQRKIIKQAILENQEKLGNFTIGEWLQKFDQRYNVDEREDRDIINFFLTDKDATFLGETEKTILKSIFHTYDTLIATELIDIFDAVEMLKNLNKVGSSADFSSELSVSQFQPQSRYQRPSSQPFTKAPASFREEASLVNLPLSEALRIYPEIGEQLVTSNKINLRNFPYPVRPSIKNWIADYTFVLGYEKHESMARSQYLFQGPNTKNLSAPEKNKLAYLLKSFDENSSITLNKNTKQVIFPTIASVSSNLPKGLSDQFRPASAPKEEQKNINAMQFSYRQKLPYEKTIAPPAPIKSLPQNFSNSPRNFQPSSREIPTEYRGAEHISQNKPNPWKFPEKPTTQQDLPKNVVDLKNINQ